MFSDLDQRKTSLKPNQTKHKARSELNGGGQVILPFSPPWAFDDAVSSANDFL